MEIYLIRHTAPDIAEGVCYGQADIPLSRSFEGDLISVKKLLPERFDKVYSSPLMRCVTLAKNIMTDELVIDERLLEISFGEWELKKWNEIEKNDLNRWMNNFVNERPPGGESMQQLQKRVVEWYHEIKQIDTKRMAVVSHAGVIRILIAYLESITLQQSFDRIKITYGEVFKLEA